MEQGGGGVKLFTCTRHDGDLRITRIFCGESWLRAEATTSAEDLIRLAPCLGCKTGEKHATAIPMPPVPIPSKARYTVSPRANPHVPLRREPRR